MRGVPVVDAAAVATATVTDDVTPARRARAVPLASSSPSSVVASDEDVLLPLPKRFRLVSLRVRRSLRSSTCRNFAATKIGIGHGIWRNERDDTLNVQLVCLAATRTRMMMLPNDTQFLHVKYTLFGEQCRRCYSTHSSIGRGQMNTTVKGPKFDDSEVVMCENSCPVC